MRKLLRAPLAGAVVVLAMANFSTAQEVIAGDAPHGASIDYGTTATLTPAQVFSSPLGFSQGYGYYPYVYNPGRGGLMYYHAYYDGSVTSPFRPGSTNYLPYFGYYASGRGPVMFPDSPHCECGY
jgi:hypothetical protein